MRRTLQQPPKIPPLPFRQNFPTAYSNTAGGNNQCKIGRKAETSRNPRRRMGGFGIVQPCRAVRVYCMPVMASTGIIKQMP